MASEHAESAGHNGDILDRVENKPEKTHEQVTLDTPPSETLAKAPSPSLTAPSDAKSHPGEHAHAHHPHTTFHLGSTTSMSSSSSKDDTPMASTATSKDPTPTGTPSLSPTKASSPPPTSLPLSTSSGSGTASASASAAAAVAAHALPEEIVPRRGSFGAYQSTRPAPPSPAPSRRQSGIGFYARERASSSTSSTSGSASHLAASSNGSNVPRRRPSNSSNGNNGSRPASRVRPRSSLGTSYLTAEVLGLPPDDVPSDTRAETSTPNSGSGGKLSDTAVPEGEEPSASAPASAEASFVLSPTPDAAPAAPANPTDEGIPVTIRDYAYPASDDRYRGIPAHISPRNSRQNSGPIWHPRGSDGPFGSASSGRKASTTSSGSGTSRGGGVDGDRRPSGAGGSGGGGGGVTFGGFSFGADDHGKGGGDGSKKGWSGLNLLGWRGFLGRKASTGGVSSSSEGGTRRGDMGDEEEDDKEEEEEEIDIVNPPDDYAFESSSSDAGDDGDDDSRYGGGGLGGRGAAGGGTSGTFGGGEGGGGPPEEEPKGLYRVAYTFEAEGEHEVGVEEGEVVLVKGRGGGEGWVIAVKVHHHRRDSELANADAAQVDRIEGLIPEGYLEKVSVDGESEYAWMHDYAEERDPSATPSPMKAQPAQDQDQHVSTKEQDLLAKSSIKDALVTRALTETPKQMSLDSKEDGGPHTASLKEDKDGGQKA